MAISLINGGIIMLTINKKFNNPETIKYFHYVAVHTKNIDWSQRVNSFNSYTSSVSTSLYKYIK
jgi:hypothetical protein